MPLLYGLALLLLYGHHFSEVSATSRETRQSLEACAGRWRQAESAALLLWQVKNLGTGNYTIHGHTLYIPHTSSTHNTQACTHMYTHHTTYNAHAHTCTHI